MLKKSYTGFILWLIAYMAAIFLLPLLPFDDEGLMIRLVFVITAIALLLLMLMIFVSQKVYWINGVTYEDAVAAGAERRRAFALRHLIRFGVLTAGYCLFAFVGQIVGIPFWVDIIVFTVGTIAAAVSTVRIKL